MQHEPRRVLRRLPRLVDRGLDAGRSAQMRATHRQSRSAGIPTVRTSSERSNVARRTPWRRCTRTVACTAHGFADAATRACGLRRVDAILGHSRRIARAAARWVMNDRGTARIGFAEMDALDGNVADMARRILRHAVGRLPDVHIGGRTIACRHAAPLLPL